MWNSPLQVELLPSSLLPPAPHPLLFVSLFFLWASLPVHLWIKLPVSFCQCSHCPLKPLCSRLLSLKRNSSVKTQTAALQFKSTHNRTNMVLHGAPSVTCLILWTKIHFVTRNAVFHDKMLRFDAFYTQKYKRQSHFINWNSKVEL